MQTDRTLKNAPLVEAIFEVRWQLEEIQPGLSSDPHYSLLIGSLYQQIRQNYPFHQPLPTAAIPEEMVAGVAQHRFRVDQDQWPLIQLGPGIFTVNETTSYTWAKFKQHIIEGFQAFFAAHPTAQELVIRQLALRYINAIEFDFEQDDVFLFLKDKLKTDISLPAPLFEGDKVKNKPSGLDYQFAFECHKPESTMRVRLARGRKDQQDALIWEMSILSQGGAVPDLPAQLEEWLDDAHEIIENWFFKLIAGDLEKRFE